MIILTLCGRLRWRHARCCCKIFKYSKIKWPESEGSKLYRVEFRVTRWAIHRLKALSFSLFMARYRDYCSLSCTLVYCSDKLLPESFQTTAKIFRVGHAHLDFFQGGGLPTLLPRAGAPARNRSSLLHLLSSAFALWDELGLECSGLVTSLHVTLYRAAKKTMKSNNNGKNTYCVGKQLQRCNALNNVRTSNASRFIFTAALVTDKRRPV